MAKLLVTGALVAASLWGCAGTPAPAPASSAPSTTPPTPLSAPTPVNPPAPNSPAASPARYRCDDNIEFTVRFADDMATVDVGPRGADVLLRDAGGTTPQQSFYSNPRMRAEFGLGVSGREAILRYTQEPLIAHCVQE
jgi:hypothetical protein